MLLFLDLKVIDRRSKRSLKAAVHIAPFLFTLPSARARSILFFRATELIKELLFHSFLFVRLIVYSVYSSSDRRGKKAYARSMGKPLFGVGCSSLLVIMEKLSPMVWARAPFIFIGA